LYKGVARIRSCILAASLVTDANRIIGSSAIRFYRLPISTDASGIMAARLGHDQREDRVTLNEVVADSEQPTLYVPSACERRRISQRKTRACAQREACSLNHLPALDTGAGARLARASACRIRRSTNSG
jgi:hypothetical protein